MARHSARHVLLVLRVLCLGGTVLRFHVYTISLNIPVLRGE